MARHAAAAAHRVRARTSVAPARRPGAAARLVRAPHDDARATPEDILANDLRAIWSGRGLRRGTTSVYVTDAVTGAPLFAIHEDRGMNPASNVKLVSTATALAVLGPDWRYVTRLLGPVPQDGVIRGDLYLLGSADPTLRVRHLRELAASLAQSGVERVDGAIVASADRLRDTVGHSNVQIEVTGTADGKPPIVAVSPVVPDLVTVGVTATTRRRMRRSRVSAGVRAVAGPDGARYAITVTGRVLPGRTVRLSRRIPAGARYTTHVLRAELMAAGIAVTGGVRSEELDRYVATGVERGFLPVELGRHDSAPVSDIVARINKPSNNFLADRLLMTAGAVRYGGAPALDKGVAAMKEWLAGAGLDPDEVVVDTGSGLSYASRFSARQLVHILRAGAGYLDARRSGAVAVADVAGAAPAQLAPSADRAGVRMLRAETLGAAAAPAAGLEASAFPAAAAALFEAAAFGGDRGDVFIDSLAIAGVDGTLRGRFRGSPVEGRFRGKTGTLNGVISLSGFVSIGDGDTVSFAIVTNGHRHRRRMGVRFEHSAMVKAMMRYLEARRAARQQVPVAPSVGAAAGPEAIAPALGVPSSAPPVLPLGAAPTPMDEVTRQREEAAAVADGDAPAEPTGASEESLESPDDGEADDGEADEPAAGEPTPAGTPAPAP
jgi:D-alanyl-D-alanine carboxypeptidase/D-alanyl-D-alanine-endopeptidase (penicillin-binding protein 4)